MRCYLGLIKYIQHRLVLELIINIRTNAAVAATNATQTAVSALETERGGVQTQVTTLQSKFITLGIDQLENGIYLY